MEYGRGFPAVIFCLVIASCSHGMIVKNLDLSKGRLSRDVNIAVDGRMDEKAWDSSPVILIEETGEARFVWDDRAVYGFVSVQEGCFTAPDDRVSVSIATSEKGVVLSLEQGETSREMVLNQAILQTVGPAGEVVEEPLPPGTIEVVSDETAGKSDFDRSVEIALPWSCLDLSSPEEDGITVRAYRHEPAPGDSRLTLNQDEKYYAVFLDGRKVGYGTGKRTVEPGRISNKETLNLILKYGFGVMSLAASSTYIEKPDGKPIGFEDVEELHAKVLRIVPVKHTSEVIGVINSRGELEVTTTDKGKIKQHTVDWPVGALMEEGFRLLLKETGLKEGASFTASAFDLKTLQSYDIECRVGQTKEVNLLDRTESLTEVVLTLKKPSDTTIITVYSDSDLNELKEIYPIKVGLMESVACSREFALSEDEVLDMTAWNCLHSPVSLNPYRDRSIRYHLVPKDEEKLQIHAGDNQIVLPDGKGGLFVTVRPVKAPRETTFPYDGSDEIVLEALRPTEYVQSDDEEIIALAKEAVGETKDAYEAAMGIKKFVDRYVRNRKGFFWKYYTAKDVAERREGTCVEHAVLSAAMCRAAGIPARVVLGYIYRSKDKELRDVFVRHAWTQVYIGGKWIGLDAAGFRYTPGHLAEVVAKNASEEIRWLRDRAKGCKFEMSEIIQSEK